MSTINKQVLKIIREDINDSLHVLAEKHGLSSLELGNASYDADQFTFKLTGVRQGGLSAEAKRYQYWNTPERGHPPVNSVVVVDGARYMITGLNSTGTKILTLRLSDESPRAASVEWLKRAELVA